MLSSIWRAPYERLEVPVSQMVYEYGKDDLFLLIL